MDILDTLGINAGLLLAQVVNFVIVASVLTYFLYKPVLKVIDERRERIRKSMEDAERIAGQKAEMDALRQKELSKIDREAGKILEEAKKKAESTRASLVDQAEIEAAEMLAKAKQQIRDERMKVYEELKQNVTTLILRLSEKILEREFSKEDQSRMVATLEKELSKQSS